MYSLRQLQTTIASLRAERGHIQQLIQQYDQLLNARLGTLLARLSDLQQAVNTRRASQSRRRSEQDELVSWQPRSITQPTFSTTQPSLTPRSTANESLKKLYRRAVSLAHPDLFAGDPEREARATEVMGQLNAAHEREDSEAVRELLADLEDGLPFLDLPGQDPNPEAIERIVARLTNTRDELVRELSVLRRSENYRIMSDETIDLAAHFHYLEQRCLAQIELLMKSVA